ncbi:MULTISPECIES: MFS transporter [unclassified Pseudofrankia]|uniref:MFS transporter n=1 Tax=unclassified Pseudofrankia TaxID=2994372 RepID=UPI0009F2B2A3|nr:MULTISPECIES: MFS transporter [unclassified Pseudofrankia]MDT3445101.1 MFS transporter [Pseudofrankia sp. BMG5.37]
MILAAGARSTPPAVSVAVLCAGGMTVSFTQTLVIPIQSELPQLLGTSPSNAPWVVTITLLAAAVAMVVAGRLADLFGKQRVLVVSAALLVAGSLVCALSSTLTPMLVGRALQGVSLGFIPVGISLIREITPPRMAPTALATMSATLGVGGAIGLPLAAWIVHVGSWHTLFWVSTVVAAVILVLTIVAIPHVHDSHGGRFDLVGALGLAVGLVVFLIGISKATDWGWGSARTLGAIAGGLVVLVAWGAFELRQPEPLVDLRSTAKLPVLMTNVAAMAVGFGMMAQSIVIPQLLGLPKGTGYGLGQSIQAVGLWMAPAGLMMLLFAPISSALIGGIGPRITLMIGALVIAAGYGLGTLLMDASWQLLIVTCVASAGVGIGYAAMPTLILDATPAAKAAAAVGLNSLSRSVGSSVAAALMGTLLTSNTTAFGPTELPSQRAFTLCFGVGAAAALLGAGLAAFIPRRRPDRAGTAAAVVAAGKEDVPSAV